jgi:hypothetical protein
VPRSTVGDEDDGGSVIHSARSSVLSGLSHSEHEHDGSGDETDDVGTHVSGAMTSFTEDDASVSRPGTAMTTTSLSSHF